VFTARYGLQQKQWKREISPYVRPTQYIWFWAGKLSGWCKACTETHSSRQSHSQLSRGTNCMRMWAITHNGIISECNCTAASTDSQEYWDKARKWTTTLYAQCFVWISEQTAIISLYNINWLVCVTETDCVYKLTSLNRSTNAVNCVTSPREWPECENERTFDKCGTQQQTPTKTLALLTT
jgi:hypothetical protein